MTRPHFAVPAAFALALCACSPPPLPAPPDGAANAAAPAPQAPAVTDDIAGTGERMPATEPATDEVATTPGSDAEDTQYFDFSGTALDRVRGDARPANPGLRDAARRLVDQTAAERACEAFPEGERLFMRELDGQPGEEALLLYTMQACGEGGGGNYYDRNGYVLREQAGEWQPVAEFSLGTSLVGNATVSAFAPGVIVVTPEQDTIMEPQRVEIPAP